MEPELIKKVAEQMVQYLPAYSWSFWIAQVALTVLAAAIGAFLGEYLKTRGQHLATKADFHSLQTQLKANTELVETVKAEVNQKDLVKREWRNIRCIKLEHVLTKLHDCEDHLHQLCHDALDRKVVQVGDPLGEVKTIATLYLPELKKEVGAYTLAYRKQRLDLFKYRGELIKIPPDTLIPKSLFDKHNPIIDSNWSSILKAEDELTSAAASLLHKIMDVA